MRVPALLTVLGVAAACSSTTENEGKGAGGASSGGASSCGASGGGGSSGGVGGLAGASGADGGPPLDASSDVAPQLCELPGNCDPAKKGCSNLWEACQGLPDCKCSAPCILACDGPFDACRVSCGVPLNATEAAAAKNFVDCMGGSC